MSEILENNEGSNPPDMVETIQSKIDALIEGGIEAANRYGRGKNAITVKSLKGI
jgi:hypothetical protein